MSELARLHSRGRTSESATRLCNRWARSESGPWMCSLPRGTSNMTTTMGRPGGEPWTCSVSELSPKLCSTGSLSEAHEQEPLSLTEYTPQLCSEGSRQSCSRSCCRAVRFRRPQFCNVSLYVVPVVSLVPLVPLVLASSLWTTCCRHYDQGQGHCFHPRNKNYCWTRTPPGQSGTLTPPRPPCSLLPLWWPHPWLIQREWVWARSMSGPLQPKHIQ